MTSVVPRLAINTGYRQVLTDADLTIDADAQFGPAGIMLGIHCGASRGSAIVTQFDDASGAWLHASLAWAGRTPTHYEVRTLHRAVFGRRRWAYHVHAPADRYVDGTKDGGHPHALHLWGRVDGTPALADEVGQGGHL